MVVDGKLWGELYATRNEGTAAFTEFDAAYIAVLAAILAGAVSRALHVESLERRALLDPLTGLANRWAFNEAIERAFDAVAGRVPRRVTVVMVDVNGLKAVKRRARPQRGGPSAEGRCGTALRRLQQLARKSRGADGW